MHTKHLLNSYMYVHLYTTHSLRAMLYVSHGVGEHMDRYDELGTNLAENGVLVFGHDHGENIRAIMLLSN